MDLEDGGKRETTDNRERRYDTFVVRLWRDIVSRRVLRAEVEHVQSGHRSKLRWRSASDDGDGLDWITDQIRAAAAVSKREGEE